MTEKELKALIIERDKIQTRDKTAEELGMSLTELTKISKRLGIRKFIAPQLSRKYTRMELYSLIKNKDKVQNRKITANELNTSEHTIRELLKEIEERKKT